MVNFKDFFRKSSVFIIDDIQFIRGKEGLQEEFFHTFNSLIDKSSQVIISADRAPMKLDRVQERIKSRLAGGLVVDIDAPDLDLKVKIIKRRLEDIQNKFKESSNISEEVINFIATESKTNVRELIGVLNRVVTFSRIHKKTLTIGDCKNFTASGGIYVNTGATTRIRRYSVLETVCTPICSRPTPRGRPSDEVRLILIT